MNQRRFVRDKIAELLSGVRYESGSPVLDEIPAMIACADRTDTGTPADTTAAVHFY